LVAGEQELDVVKLGNETLQTGEIANYGLANDKGEIVAVSKDGKVYTALAKATQQGDLAGASAVTGYTITFQETVDTGKVTLTTTENASGQTASITDIKATGSVDVTGLAAGSYSVVEPVDAATVKGLEKLTADAAGTISHVLVNADNEAIAVSEDGTEWFAVSDLDFSKDDDTDLPANLVADAKAIMTVATALVDGDEVQVKADGGIDVSSQVAADKAITVINEAIETVSAERSKLGAMQNRLEHTIANLGTSAENLQAAESRIRDLDMAEEIMAFTKNSILQQAATAMLAQANMAPQSVLQLLG
jgi:flagellin